MRFLNSNTEMGYVCGKLALGIILGSYLRQEMVHFMI